MAETNSLLNCRTGNCTGGSNPPPSASFHEKPSPSPLELGFLEKISGVGTPNIDKVAPSEKQLDYEKKDMDHPLPRSSNSLGCLGILH